MHLARDGPFDTEIGQHRQAGKNEYEAEPAEQVKRIFQVFPQENDGQQIKWAIKEPARAEFGDAELSRMVRHRHFRDFIAVPMGQRRQVAMAFAIDLQALERGGAVGFEPAVEVVQLDAGHY